MAVQLILIKENSCIVINKFKDKTGCWHGDHLPEDALMKLEKGDGVVCPNCLILISRYDGRLQYREIAKATVISHSGRTYT